MYEWIVDGLSSLFVPFSTEKPEAWPCEQVNGIAAAAGTETPRQENSRPTKRNYQSINSSEGVSEDPKVKRARHDVIFRVVKKTLAGIAGLLHPRRHRKAEQEKQNAFPQVDGVTFKAIDVIYSNSLSSWSERDGMSESEQC
ncbi:hypothetical protein DNTS_018834 [Danionella cerebrum]|uniref:Uncharacterized protein n=1 Tax=Danionella cerebrum TaxID=2873325 RepID=A0A553MS71_9TELE|nr:hypothetical protein DNTS_018834 [Danionella translucida]